MYSKISGYNGYTLKKASVYAGFSVTPLFVT